MEGGDESDNELEDSDCLPRLLEDVQSVHVVSSYFAHVLASAAFIRGRRLFHSAPPIVRHLFKGGVYLRVASIR